MEPDENELENEEINYDFDEFTSMDLGTHLRQTETNISRRISLVPFRVAASGILGGGEEDVGPDVSVTSLLIRSINRHCLKLHVPFGAVASVHQRHLKQL